jgi:hypothetical protein
MNLPETRDPLSPALGTWRLAPRRNPQFRTDVWARIETARKGSSWATYARSHAALVAGVLAVAVVAGALTGREQARTRVALERDRLADSYVESMDARLMRMP